MRQTYHIRVRPQLLAPAVSSLTAESFLERLAGLAVHEILTNSSGEALVHLELRRASHEDALNEILAAVQQLGYTWLEARVFEWADKALIGAVAGALGGGTAGSASNDGSLATVAALIGLLAGALIGSFFAREKVYQVHRTPRGWVLTPLTPDPGHALSQPALLSI